MFMFRLTGTYFVILSIFISAFSKLEIFNGGNLSLHFAPLFSGQNLVLEKQLYHLSNGDSLYVDKLRFYITAVELVGKDGVFTEINSCHLIDAEESVTQSIELQDVPEGTYTSLRFLVGIDSLHNVSGAQGGDLDPTLGMYWAWNSGYVNVKMEGRSTACRTLHQAFEFHLGGYMPPFQSVQQVVLPIQVQVSKRQPADLSVSVELAKFFGQLDLRTTNQVMQPSRTAVQLAGYFKNVFSSE